MIKDHRGEPLEAGPVRIEPANVRAVELPAQWTGWKFRVDRQPVQATIAPTAIRAVGPARFELPAELQPGRRIEFAFTD